MGAAVSLKVKGIQGVKTFGAKGPAFGGMNAQGLVLSHEAAARLGVGKNVALNGAQLGGTRLAATGKAATLKVSGIGTDCATPAIKGGFGSGKSLVAAKGGAAANAKAMTAAAKTAAAKGAAAGASGTIWTGTGLSLGLGLGLGAWGPALLLGTLGLVATGAYLYHRNRQLAAEEEAEGVIEDAVFAG